MPIYTISQSSLLLEKFWTMGNCPVFRGIAGGLGFAAPPRTPSLFVLNSFPNLMETSESPR